MSYYKNNKDGTLTSIARNSQIVEDPPENYVTQEELARVLNNMHDVEQYEELPAPHEEIVGKIVQYVGETTESLTHGYIYQCEEVMPVTDPKTYEWVRINVQPATGEYDDDDWVELTPGYNITADRIRIRRSGHTVFFDLGITMGYFSDGVSNPISGNLPAKYRPSSSITFQGFNGNNAFARIYLNVGSNGTVRLSTGSSGLGGYSSYNNYYTWYVD